MSKSERRPNSPQPLSGIAVLLIALTGLSALLLFMVQPMVARMLLPSVGGSPSLWSICAFFFQTLLVGACAWVHVSSRKLPRGVHVSVQLAFTVAATLVALSTAAPQGSPEDGRPVLWVLGALGVVAAAARDLGKTGLYWRDDEVTDLDAIHGKLPSTWALLSNRPTQEAVGPFRVLASYGPPGGLPAVWTDRHASPLSVRVTSTDRPRPMR
jgi:hypothetical protein